MDFFKLIHSLDEILYEVASWLLFYPITLWRMIHAPLKTMKAAERELSEEEPKQFDDMVPPPLCWSSTRSSWGPRGKVIWCRAIAA